jgi:hypothetical protein
MKHSANIFVLVDALGWEWLKSIPFLSEHAPYRCPLTTVFGFSTGAIPSILTGVYPEAHGRVAMFHRVPENQSPFRDFAWLCMMPRAMVENRYVRHLVEYGVKAFHGFGGHFDLYAVPLRLLPMLDICEKSDIYRPGGIAGSTSIFDVLEAGGQPYRAYSYHQGSDFELIRMAHDDLKNGDASFYFIYLSQVDAFLHEHADRPELVRDLLSQYQERLVSLIDTATRRHGSARFHLFSDHGMAPTRRTVDVHARLNALPLRVPHAYLALLDSTMIRFWYFDGAAREAVHDVLPADENGNWLAEKELRALRAYFADHRYGDEIYLLNEGVVAEPSHMGAVAPRGMHGFSPNAPHSMASFISSEDYDGSLQSITDIFKIMREYC